MIRLFFLSFFCLFALSARAADTLHVVLDWFINPVHTHFVVAKEQGFFKANGLDVELSEPTDAAIGAKLVAAGKADLAIAYEPQFHLYRAQGLPVIRVSTLIATPLNTLLVLKDSNIKTLADLKGKTIGYSVAGFEDTLLKALLAEAGLTLQDVKTVNINWSITPALMSKQVDAVIGGYRNFERHELELAGHPGLAFYPEEHGIPTYDEMIVIAREDRAHDDRIRRFNLALAQAAQFTLNHPDEAWQDFIRYKPDANDKLNRIAFYDTLPRLALRPGANDLRRYQRFADFLLKYGMITQPQKAQDLTVEP